MAGLHELEQRVERPPHFANFIFFGALRADSIELVEQKNPFLCFDKIKYLPKLCAGFAEILGDNFINTLTDEKKDGYENGKIDTDFLRDKIDNFAQHFYVCGPPPFIEAISKALNSLGAKTDAVVFEK